MKKFKDFDEEDIELDRKQKMKDRYRKIKKREKNIMRSKNLNVDEMMNFYEENEKWY